MQSPWISYHVGICLTGFVGLGHSFPCPTRSRNTCRRMGHPLSQHLVSTCSCGFDSFCLLCHSCKHSNYDHIVQECQRSVRRTTRCDSLIMVLNTWNDTAIMVTVTERLAMVMISWHIWSAPRTPHSSHTLSRIWDHRSSIFPGFLPENISEQTNKEADGHLRTTCSFYLR